MLEHPDCMSVSRSWSVPFSYVVLSTRLLRLALGSSPCPSQHGLLSPAPASPHLETSRLDLGEEQPQLSPLRVKLCPPPAKPHHPGCSIPCGRLVPSPLRSHCPQQLGTASHGSDSSATPVPRYKSLRVCAQSCSEQVLSLGS